MSSADRPDGGAGRARRVVLARALPDAEETTPDHTVHLRVRSEQVSLDLDLDAVALVIPTALAARVAGVVRWVRPPEPHALQLCREIDVCAAITTALREPPPSSPSAF